MNVTTAEQKILEAKDKLAEAYKALLNVLDEDTWGHSDFREEYIEIIQNVAMNILKMKRKL